MNKMEIYEMRYEDISSLCKKLDKIVVFHLHFLGSEVLIKRERIQGTTKVEDYRLLNMKLLTWITSKVDSSNEKNYQN